MNIRKVSLNNGGFKGAEVHFLQEEEKSGKSQIVLHKTYPKNPVHMGLEKLFKDLRGHILNIYDIRSDEEAVNDFYINQTIVHTVECDLDCIVLHGQREVCDGKVVPLKSHKIQMQDDYDNYEDLRAIVERIAEETIEYLRGNVKIEDKELIERYLKARHKDDAISSLEGMTAEQMQEFVTKIVEKGMGGFVMLPDDFKLDKEAIAEAAAEHGVEVEVDDSDLEDAAF